MPLLQSRFLDSGRKPSKVEWLFRFHEQLFALVDDRPRLASVDSHRHVLSRRQQLDRLHVAVADLFVAEHRRHGIVADVVADAQAAAEDLDGEVLVETLVEDDSLRLVGQQKKGDVGTRLVLQRRQGQVGVLVKETDAAQLFTLLSLKS